MGEREREGREREGEGWGGGVERMIVERKGVDAMCVVVYRKGR